MTVSVCLQCSSFINNTPTSQTLVVWLWSDALVDLQPAGPGKAPLGQMSSGSALGRWLTKQCSELASSHPHTQTKHAYTSRLIVTRLSVRKLYSYFYLLWVSARSTSLPFGGITVAHTLSPLHAGLSAAVHSSFRSAGAVLEALCNRLNPGTGDHFLLHSAANSRLKHWVVQHERDYIVTVHCHEALMCDRGEKNAEFMFQV